MGGRLWQRSGPSGGGRDGQMRVLCWLGAGGRRSHFSGCPVIPAWEPDTWARFLACVVFEEGGR